MARQKLGIYKKETIGFRVSREVLRNIDHARGSMQRSEFLAEAVEKLFRVSENYIALELMDNELARIGIKARLEQAKLNSTVQRKIQL